MSDATSWYCWISGITLLVEAGSVQMQRRLCKIPTDHVKTPPVMLLTVHTSQAVGRSLVGFDKKKCKKQFQAVSTDLLPSTSILEIYQKSSKIDSSSFDRSIHLESFRLVLSLSVRSFLYT